MEKKRVAFYTLGCKVNQYETNGMIQKFQDRGYEIVNFDEEADIYIINTCTVTSISDRKSRQMLRQAKKLNPDAIVVACGCYVQVSKDEVDAISEIDLTVGTNEKASIVEYIEDFINKKSRVNLKEILYKAEYDEFGSVTYTEKTRAVIKVQDGCNRFCSYCIIPYARGKVRSRQPENVIEEISRIAEEGIKEVVLTGIHLASYGIDFENEYRLIDLIEDINKIDGIERIRLGSIEPLLISEEFVGRLKKVEKACHHFHLSLQSGCNEILKRMNRRYTVEEFEEIVERLRDAFEDCILTTDIIVGFPGETDEEFEKTYNYLKKINFYKMHVFKYSIRKGTKAAEMENQVDGNDKEKRSKRLIELSDENERAYLDSYIGKTVSVLFEEQENEYYKGHTSNYLLVKKSSRENISNTVLEVVVEKREDMSLIGM